MGKQYGTEVDYILETDNPDVDENLYEFEVKNPRRSIEDPVTFKKCRAYRPDEAQIAVVMGETGRRSTLPTQIAGVIDFFNSICDDDTSSYISNRLLDRHDPFGVLDVQEIWSDMLEEWFGDPTGGSSGSTSSPKNAGRKSKQPTPA